MIPDGFYKSLPMEEYLNYPGLSKSGLALMAKSPAHYQASLTEPPKPSAVFDLGSAVHMLVLEPEKAASGIAVPPPEVLAKNGARNTNAYRDWSLSLPASTLVLSIDEYNTAVLMSNSIKAHPAASDLLKCGNPEVSVFHMEPSGLRRKCRPDYLTDYYACDVKTTVDASPNGFSKQSWNLNYHYSAAWTTDTIDGLGNPGLDYYFIAVEKTPPYLTAVYQATPELIERARVEIAALVETYRLCKENNRWPGYPDSVMPLQMPRWAN